MLTTKTQYFMFDLPLVKHHDLLVCYDAKNDRMIYSHQDVKKHRNMPLILSIPAYLVGLFNGFLSDKKFNQLKKDLLLSIREDYKSANLSNKNNATYRLLNSYDIYDYYFS